MLKIVSVVGARPNFVKLAPVARALAGRPGVEHLIIHTGQHYDPLLSDKFFEELEIPTPDFNLEVGSGTHAVQTAAVLERIEPLCQRRAPAEMARIWARDKIGGSPRGVDSATVPLACKICATCGASARSRSGACGRSACVATSSAWTRRL